MTVLDAYALIAFLIGGPARPAVRALLREGDAAVATANLAEALEVSQRVHGLAIPRAVQVLDTLFDEAAALLPLNHDVAIRAATIRAEHYHRSRRPISLADAVLLASAGPGSRVATADPDILAVAAALEIGAVPLPQQS